jgi:formate hydrogenlyase subunit 3/multisubunit Na+/H+ antiporter MnhD subunit
MTRDLFNVFVFMEISGISLFGILSTSRDGRVFEAGFKYMIASGLASAFYLIGTAFTYRGVGSLNIADIAEASTAGSLSGTVGILGLLFLLAGLLVELKPAPANGWALDTYQAADHGVGALISGINATAMTMVLFRLAPIFFQAAESVFLPILVAAGAVAFLVPQVQALLQGSFKRLLGYSSVAQIGLVVLAFAVAPADVSFGAAGVSVALPVALVLLINHALAKAGLFWIAHVAGDDRTGAAGNAPASLRHRRGLLILAGILVLALLGLPPFPGFWAKWNLVMHLGAAGSGATAGGATAGGAVAGSGALLAVVLLGSFLEVIYLMRWFAGIARRAEDDGTVLEERIPEDFAPAAPAAVEVGASATPPPVPAAPAAALAAGGMVLLLVVLSGLGLSGAGIGLPILVVLLAVVAFTLLDFLRVPVRVQVALAIGGLGYYLSTALPGVSGLRLIFAGIFGVGAMVQLIAFFARKGRHPGLVGMTTGMVLSLLALLTASSGLSFFVAWELMTLTSFFLVIRGRQAGGAAYRYITFSLASAFLMLASFGLGGGELFAALAGEESIFTFGMSAMVVVPTILLVLAVLIKLGALGLHIWLPPAYAEAEDDVSSLMSSVLSKAGLFVLFAGATVFTMPLWGGIPLNAVLGWVGVATALAGAMMALFQEDIKYTLAYSSMSQVGYMVLAFALMSHLGWVTALYLAVTHLLFKAMLFLAIAGVVMRTGTRLMYQMGGLIRRMPLTFISVLMAIIALSGVPPLSGFGGKWLLYTSLIESGWHLQAALAFFASGVAFLYLFRLIHAIFLGQRKAIHDQVTEAPAVVLIPQFLFIAGIMAVSMFPNLLIQPLQGAVEATFASTVQWQGYAVISSLGYWNGNAVMYVTMGVFIAPLIWLLAVKGRVYKVEQFNIVYAAERPHTPETTHYAFNFFGHYKKAFGSLLNPWVQRFWAGAASTGNTISGALRGWNTGNPQTYAFQIMLYLLLTFLIARGGL